MNNKAITEFKFLIIWRIMKVKEDVNVRGRKAEAYLTDKAELEV